MLFDVKGRPKHVSLPEFRSILHACGVVLSYHKLYTKNPTELISVNLKPRKDFESGYVGFAYYDKQTMNICNDLQFSQMVTVVLHEYIHLVITWKHSTEKRTSTLTSRLKEDVVLLANILANGTYKRAAYIAHTKISYMTDGEDYYDKDQYHKRHPESEGEKYRKKS